MTEQRQLEQSGSLPGLTRSLAGKLVAAFLIPVLIMASVAGLAAHLDWPPKLIFVLCLGLGVAATALTVNVLYRGLMLRLEQLYWGGRALLDRDYSTRLTVRGRDELDDLVTNFNDIVETVNEERKLLYQKELMLDTVFQSSPMAIVLTDMGGRVSYANRMARQMFAEGHKLDGLSLAEVLAAVPPELAGIFAKKVDTLASFQLAGRPEVFHFSCRAFHLNGGKHDLYLLKTMTVELNRQEIELWKKVIRIISHELNNSLAPISSLIQSSRKIRDKPEHRDKLDLIFETIEDRAKHLASFLGGYAAYAKLPKPNPIQVPWAHFLERMNTIAPFVQDGEAPDENGWFDAIQLEQVFLNLLKNAEEAGSPAGQTRVRVVVQGDAHLLTVTDSGMGMPDDVMHQATLPFFTTKPRGSGLGLALCREILEAHGGVLKLERVTAGGTRVVCRLPCEAASNPGQERK